MNVIGFCIIVVYFSIGLMFALTSLRLCALRLGKFFLIKKGIGSKFTNRTLIIVNNLWLWPLYFPSLMNELGVIRIPDWLNIIR